MVTFQVAEISLGYAGNRVPQLKWLFVLLFTIFQSLETVLFGFILFLMNLLVSSAFAMVVLQSHIEERMDDATVNRFGQQTVDDCRQSFTSLLSSMATTDLFVINDRNSSAASQSFGASYSSTTLSTSTSSQMAGIQEAGSGVEVGALNSASDSSAAGWAYRLTWQASKQGHLFCPHWIIPRVLVFLKRK